MMHRRQFVDHVQSFLRLSVLFCAQAATVTCKSIVTDLKELHFALKASI